MCFFRSALVGPMDRTLHDALMLVAFQAHIASLPFVAMLVPLEAMVEIQETLAISFAGATFVQIPAGLVHVGNNGVKFLKLPGSHPAICKLFCGKETEVFKECRNPSCAGSNKLVTLKEKVQDALKKALACQEGEDPLFESAGSSAGSTKKKVLPKVTNAPETLSVVLLGVVVEVLAPRSWDNEDVYVKLETSMLEAVFNFLHSDCLECLKAPSRRCYNKSGALKRKAGED